MSNTLPPRNFGSVAVAMVTPFKEDGSLDIDTAVQLADRLVNEGCDALVLSGTTGESPTTHQPEKDELTREVVKAVGERAKIIAGAGSNDTAHAVRIAQGAQECGAHGLLVLAPYYNRPSQEGVYQHIHAALNRRIYLSCFTTFPGAQASKWNLTPLNVLQNMSVSWQ